MSKRIIGGLAIPLEDGREAVQGEVVDLTPEHEAWLEGMGQLVPKDFESFEAWSDHKMNAYRAGRGDVLAAGRLEEARRGGVVDIDLAAANDPAAFGEWIATEKPTIDETVAVAEGDPEKAQAVLEGERLATGGEPRAGVQKALKNIIDREG